MISEVRVTYKHVRFSTVEKCERNRAKTLNIALFLSFIKNGFNAEESIECIMRLIKAKRAGRRLAVRVLDYK